MWFWPLSEHKKLSAAQLLWGRIYIVITTLHIVLLFILLFLYRGYAQLQIDAHASFISPANVVVMPLQKVVAQAKPKIKKNKESQAPIAAEIPQIQKKQKPTTGLQNVRKKDKNSALKNKKNEPVVKQVAKQAVAETPTVKEQLQQQHQEQQKIENNNQQHEELKQENDDPIYVGRQELEAMVVQQEIQREIESRWHPPQGLSPEAVCHVRMLVDWQGNIKEAVIEKSSGILIFDVHARSVAQAIALPKAVWGKELILHFNNRA